VWLSDKSLLLQLFLLLLLHFLFSLDIDIHKFLLAWIQSIDKALEELFSDDSVELNQAEDAALSHISVWIIDSLEVKVIEI
jgi:hypothetical protein